LFLLTKVARTWSRPETAKRVENARCTNAVLFHEMECNDRNTAWRIGTVARNSGKLTKHLKQPCARLSNGPSPHHSFFPHSTFHTATIMTTTTAKTAISAKDAKILDMVFNPEGTMLPDKETEAMLNTEPTGKWTDPCRIAERSRCIMPSNLGPGRAWSPP